MLIFEDLKQQQQAFCLYLAGNLMQQLEENLGKLELVTGYLKVFGSDTLFSLNFLNSLKVIGGEELVHGR